MRSIRFALTTLLLITAVHANAALKSETTMTLSNPDFASPTVQLTRAVIDWETTLMSGIAHQHGSGEHDHAPIRWQQPDLHR